ncbi:MAG TPA: type II toxin-antitoxin system prevent-host-death family antitoxin [Treponemataceae bacterium]|jgi:antitoxin YefM|nr:type II toxin-antitoxin system prevent-host-death family antitoxin [Treponemataceae bacterium]
MEVMTYTSARNNLAETMNKVCNNRDTIIITRNKEQSVVLISLEDYNALEETSYLLRSPENARRLCESIEQLESGNGTVRDIEV